MIGSAIVTRNLVKRRGKCRALDGLTLSVPRGSVLGLVGENGAGKTTWMMTVAGFLRPNAGEIDILGCGPFEAERHSGRIAILPQDSELPLEMSPYDALYRFGRLQGLSSQAARRSAQGALAAVNLSDRSNAPVRTLSHGMRKRAMVAQCFVGNPEIVLLDEPLNGLDADGMRIMREVFLDVIKDGVRSIVVSSHLLGELQKVATHYGIIRHGKMICEMTADELDASCRTYVALTAPDMSKAKNLLCLKYSRIEEDEAGYLRVYDFTSPEEVVKYLYENGICVTEIKTDKIGLEEYYIDLMQGGKK